MKDYQMMWKKLKAKLKSLEEIDSFHGLQYKKPKVSVDVLLEYMEELEEDADEDTN